MTMSAPDRESTSPHQSDPAGRGRTGPGAANVGGQHGVSQAARKRSAGTPALAWIGIFLLCLFPVWRWLWLGLTGQFGANPPEFLVRSSGIWALVALGAVLAVSPLRRWLGVSWLLRYRRMLGLFAFFYATLHLLGWALWEHGLVLASMWQDVLRRTFVLAGVLAYVPMVFMALTSTHGWMRRMGPWWRRLHASIHAVAALTLWHFWLVRAGKNDFDAVWLALAVWLVLLAARLRRQRV